MSAAGRSECEVYVDYPPSYFSRPGELWWSDGLDHGAVPVGFQRHVTSNTNYTCHPFNVFANNASYYAVISTGGIQYRISDIYPECGTPKYKVKLVRVDDLPASGSTLGKIEPRQSIPLIALVYDNLNNTVSNVDVKITIDVESNSGGHKHDDSTRHIRHMGRLAPAGGSQGSVEQNGKILVGNTGVGGLIFTFTAPQISGDHVFKAECQGAYQCKLSGPDQLWVGIEGLKLQADSPYYVLLSNRDTNHPGNHYVASNTELKLADFAAAYHNKFPNDPVLHFNDASLERGGLFDINGNWRLPHETHRLGNNVDVTANEFYHDPSQSIPSWNYIDFWNMGRYHGCYVALHSGATPNEHFHLYCP